MSPSFPKLNFFTFLFPALLSPTFCPGLDFAQICFVEAPQVTLALLPRVVGLSSLRGAGCVQRWTAQPLLTEATPAAHTLPPTANAHLNKSKHGYITVFMGS